ncbi:PAS domain S-box-containing protein [Noviherbaspirillum humi]|uniref:PAS domain S-box-containing protein n=2 Tax=Noviherbaspirillum humi TaxID=1688639 RepID=A0A239DQ40_9BURK|nr:PAS domain S-box-containing protein [Noviherbaspirillum humi]
MNTTHRVSSAQVEMTAQESGLPAPAMPSAIGIFACDDKLRLQLRQRLAATNHTIRLFTVEDLPADGIDLLIIDAVAAQRHRRRLRKMLAEASPLQLPLLLVTTSARPLPALPFRCDHLSLPANSAALDRAMHQALLRRRNSVAALDANCQRFRKTFELAPLGMVALSMGGRILACNPALSALLDFTESELLTMAPDELMSAGEARRLYRHAARTFKSGQPCQIEVKLSARFGRPLWAGMTLTRVHIADAQSSQIICAVEDISRRKFMEQALNEVRSAAARTSEPACGRQERGSASTPQAQSGGTRRQWQDFGLNPLP